MNFYFRSLFGTPAQRRSTWAMNPNGTRTLYWLRSSGQDWRGRPHSISHQVATIPGTSPISVNLWTDSLLIHAGSSVWTLMSASSNSTLWTIQFSQLISGCINWLGIILLMRISHHTELVYWVTSEELFKPVTFGSWLQRLIKIIMMIQCPLEPEEFNIYLGPVEEHKSMKLEASEEPVVGGRTCGLNVHSVEMCNCNCTSLLYISSYCINFSVKRHLLPWMCCYKPEKMDMKKDPGQCQQPAPSTTGTNLRITIVFIPNDPLLKEIKEEKKLTIK